MKSKITLFFALFLLFFSKTLFSQSTLADSCKLQFGTNLTGIFDYATELPFVDLMHNCREWYTKDHNNSGGPFNTNVAASLTYRTDGYPTEIPQTVSGQNFKQNVATVWGLTDGWPVGNYTVLFDGAGKLRLSGGASNVVQVNANKLTFDFNNPINNILELIIDSSLLSNPVHNIRVLMPGTENTYSTQPFNPTWLNRLLMFKSVRFMDWGHTNNWGETIPYVWQDTSLVSWSGRASMNYYTWTTTKGVPYEMMVKLMNDYDLNGWVCVPHRASNDYITQMANYFKTNVEANRKIYVEYSNETWNWMFGQTNWLNQYGCVDKGLQWPEGIVPYIQNCMNIWGNVFGAEKSRIVRTAGVQTGWQDVSNRIVNNITPGSIEAFSPTYYFGLSEHSDSILDNLGSSATVANLAALVRADMAEMRYWLNDQKQSIADVKQLPMLFYEGGQHITPHPFGVMPSYSNALLAIQRDTAMYNLYNEAFAFLRTLQSGSEPLQCMNFSFVAGLSAQYGSWGLLETMDQNINQIPAPKYQALKDNIHNACFALNTNEINNLKLFDFELMPNPSNGNVAVVLPESATFKNINIEIVDLLGKVNASEIYNVNNNKIELATSSLKSGIYFIKIKNNHGEIGTKKFIKL